MNPKEHLAEIIRQVEKLKLPYLLVGGHAVILYGVTRFTRDVDFLIPATSIDAWTYFLTKTFRYRLFQSSHAFLRFENESLDQFPIDFMLVNQSTWKKLALGIEIKQLSPGIMVKLPNPTHLIAMKMVALDSPHRRKDNVDWSDIIHIIQEQKLSIEDPVFRDLILRYGGEKTLKKLRKALKSTILIRVSKPRFHKKYGKPLDPLLEFNFPVPDRPLRMSPSQNIPWAQWMDEIEDWCRKYSKPREETLGTQRFVLK